VEKVTRISNGLHFLSVFMLASLVLFAISGSRGAQPMPTEYQVQAAYLYNFGRFIRWPASVTEAPSDAFNICIFGQDPFGPILNATVAGGTIGGKGVAVKRMSNPQEIVNCRILFIGSSEEGRIRNILEVLDRTPVLTVSDMPQFSRLGGMIQFVKEGNRIRFEVDLPAAQKAGLILSSELLKVAIAVRRNPTPGG
jgi:YfiR/HmsC-like